MSTMVTLATQQNELIKSIFAINNIALKLINTPYIYENTSKLRGLQIYYANAGYAAQRSLQTAYPVTAQLIGCDSFAHLARDYWTAYPPQRGDLAQWGGELSAFIATISALQTEPYLSDVASAEWALHVAATATDQATDLATLALLTVHEPDAITLQLAPGTTLLSSHYPIASILTAHLHHHPSLAEVGQKIRANTAENALVWRQGLRPMVACCMADDAAFIQQLLAGKSLLAALEPPAVDEITNFDFKAWLPQAAQCGLLLAARLL